MRYLLLGFVFLFAVQSCKIEPCLTKSYFTGSYKNFIKSVLKERKNYSEADWKSKEEKMRGFVNDCYQAHKAEMSLEDKTNFWTGYIEFMFSRHKAAIISKIQEEDSKSDVNIFDEISDSVKDLDLEKMVRETYGKDIEDAIDGVLKEVDKWGNELKKWLNK